MYPRLFLCRSHTLFSWVLAFLYNISYQLWIPFSASGLLFSPICLVNLPRLNLWSLSPPKCAATNIFVQMLFLSLPSCRSFLYLYSLSFSKEKKNKSELSLPYLKPVSLPFSADGSVYELWSTLKLYIIFHSFPAFNSPPSSLISPLYLCAGSVSWGEVGGLGLL